MSTSTTPLHPSPRPHTTSSSVVVSYLTSVGFPVRMTRAARPRTSPSRHPPLTGALDSHIAAGDTRVGIANGRTHRPQKLWRIDRVLRRVRSEDDGAPR